MEKKKRETVFKCDQVRNEHRIEHSTYGCSTGQSILSNAWDIRDPLAEKWDGKFRVIIETLENLFRENDKNHWL